MAFDALSLFNIVVQSLNSEDWHRVADLCDSGSLEELRRKFLLNHLRTLPPSVDDIIRDLPDIPRAEAEAEAARLSDMYDPEESIQLLFPGISSFAELELLNSHDFFVRWLEGQCPRTEIRELVETGEVAAEDAEAVLDPSTKMWNFVAVGAVPDGPDVVHVVFRYDASTDTLDDFEYDLYQDGAGDGEIQLHRDLRGRRHPRVVTCRKQRSGDWRILAGYELFGDSADYSWRDDEDA
jgi:hypothetical protein